MSNPPVPFTFLMTTQRIISGSYLLPCLAVPLQFAGRSVAASLWCRAATTATLWSPQTCARCAGCTQLPGAAATRQHGGSYHGNQTWLPRLTAPALARSGNSTACINEVALHPARLVPRWVTAGILSYYATTHSGQLILLPFVGWQTTTSPGVSEW